MSRTGERNLVHINMLRSVRETRLFLRRCQQTTPQAVAEDVMREVVSEDYEQVTIGRIALQSDEERVDAWTLTHARARCKLRQLLFEHNRQSVGLGMVDAVCAIGVALLYDFQTVEE